jgi:hypothetical protein
MDARKKDGYNSRTPHHYMKDGSCSAAPDRRNELTGNSKVSSVRKQNRRVSVKVCITLITRSVPRQRAVEEVNPLVARNHHLLMIA